MEFLSPCFTEDDRLLTSSLSQAAERNECGKTISGKVMICNGSMWITSPHIYRSIWCSENALV